MKISIAMTVYNTAPYLAQAIESVLNQSHADFEFIIVDDGSTDGSGEIAARFSERDNRIRLIRQANQGVAAAGNKCFEMATTDWVFRIDSDDLMYPGRLARQVTFIEEHPDVKVVSCIVDYIDEHGKKIISSQPDLFTRADCQRYADQCRPVVIPHTGAAIHRQTVLDLGGYTHDCFNDTLLFSRIVEQGGLILVMPEVLAAYRVHSNSVMSQNVFWAEVGGEWIHDNWKRRKQGQPELDWEAYRNSWRGLRALARPNRLRLVHARLHMREIMRLLHSPYRFRLGTHLVKLCLVAPDYLASRVWRRLNSSRA